MQGVRETLVETAHLQDPVASDAEVAGTEMAERIDVAGFHPRREEDHGSAGQELSPW